jgi:hypothetical protein
MGLEYTSIYSAIKLDRDYERSVNFIKSLGEDGYYPFINTNMFSFGDYKIPYYYEDMIFSFAATYKGFGLELVEWNFLVLKLENILRNVDFEIAQFHIDSYLGDFTLTWIHKNMMSSKDHLDDRYQLKKKEEWYFGYGERNMFIGYLRHKTNKPDTLENLDIGFKYPIIFDPAAVDYVRQQFKKTSQLPVGSVIDGRLKFGDALYHRVDEVLYSLVLAGKIHFGGDLGREEIIIHEQPWFI